MKTILIVEDELILTEVLSAVLEDAGYHVVTVADGRAGLAALPTVQPDLVLCDVMMPIMDGREMCRRMQAAPAFRDIPVVLMTAAPTLLVRLPSSELTGGCRAIRPPTASVASTARNRVIAASFTAAAAYPAAISETRRCGPASSGPAAGTR